MENLTIVLERSRYYIISRAERGNIRGLTLVRCSLYRAIASDVVPSVSVELAICSRFEERPINGSPFLRHLLVVGEGPSSY